MQAFPEVSAITCMPYNEVEKYAAVYRLQQDLAAQSRMASSLTLKIQMACDFVKAYDNLLEGRRI